MRVLSINEVLALGAGETVPATRGKISDVSKVTPGTNSSGPWTMQNITIVCPDNPRAKVKVKLWNQSEIRKDAVGKVLYIESALNDKGKLDGVTYVQDVYKWTEGQPLKFMIEVQKKAVVGFQDATRHEPTAPTPASTAGANPGPAKPEARTASPAASPADKATASSKRDVVADVIDAKKFLGRCESGFLLAADSSLRMIENFRAAHGLPWTPEIQKLHADAISQELTKTSFTSMFIKMDRGGILETLPVSKLDKVLAEAKSRLDAQKSSTAAK